MELSRLIRVLMVCWIVVVITIIYPVKEVEAALPPVMVEEVLLDTADKVIGYATMTRAGLRAGSTTALAKAGQVWGCRAAVTGTQLISGAGVAGAAVVGTGAAVAAGVTLPAWVPVVIAVGSVASLVSATCAIIDTIKGFGENEEVNVVGVVKTDWSWKYSEYFESPLITHADIPNGIMCDPWGNKFEIKEEYNGYCYLRWFEKNGVAITDKQSQWYSFNLRYYPGNNSLIFNYCWSGGNTRWYTKQYFETEPVEGTPGNIKYTNSSITVNGTDYELSDVSLAPKVPINDSQAIVINVPNVDLIRQNNPGWTEEQIEEEAMNMIIANPEYVMADEEFVVPPVGPIDDNFEGIGDYLLGIWERIGSIKDLLNPASDKFFLTTAFIPPSGYFEGRISDLKMIIGIDDHEEPWISPGDWEVGESSENWMVTIGGDPTPIPEITFQLIPQKILDERDVIKNWMSAGMWIFTGFFLIRKASEVLGA